MLIISQPKKVKQSQETLQARWGAGTSYFTPSRHMRRFSCCKKGNKGNSQYRKNYKEMGKYNLPRALSQLPSYHFRRKDIKLLYTERSN